MSGSHSFATPRGLGESRALSIRQPWAWAILSARKRIENRRWNTKFRGEILLHASKSDVYEEYRDACVSMLGARLIEPRSMPARSAMLRGGIVGRARIVDVIPADADDETAASIGRSPFTPWLGALGLFKCAAQVSE